MADEPDSAKEKHEAVESFVAALRQKIHRLVFDEEAIGYDGTMEHGPYRFHFRITRAERPA